MKRGGGGGSEVVHCQDVGILQVWFILKICNFQRPLTFQTYITFYIYTNGDTKW